MLLKTFKFRKCYAICLGIEFNILLKRKSYQGKSFQVALTVFPLDSLFHFPTYSTMRETQFDDT